VTDEAPQATDLASYDVTIAGCSTTVQLSYEDATAQGLYHGAISLPWADRLVLLEHQVNKLEEMMTEAVSQQATLDAAVAAINEAVTNVVSEVAALKAAAPETLDFSGLTAAVAGLQSATDAVESTETPAEPPVEPPVV